MLDIKYHNFDFFSPSFLNSKNIALDAVRSISNSIISQSDYYKIFSLNLAREMAKDCRSYVDEIRSNFSDILVIGMGGAILNPKTLISLCQEITTNISIHFIDNTDPIFLERVLGDIELQNCAVIAISNTGNTLETNTLFGIMISKYRKARIKNLQKYFYCITNVNSGILMKTAKQIDATIIPHQRKISGRYSGFSNVMSFIAQIAGIDIEQFFASAEIVISNFIDNTIDSSPALSAITLHASGLYSMVNIGYLQDFESYLEWYSQIIAESLGKNGGGITPIRGLGPNDQHSMMQLYLDGPRDKLYSLFYVENITSELYAANIEGLDYIARTNLGAINNANFQATKTVLIAKDLPVRTIMLKDLSAQSIGAIMAHSMLEIITLCIMSNINPFDQPGVEFIKIQSKKIIQSSM